MAAAWLASHVAGENYGDAGGAAEVRSIIPEQQREMVKNIAAIAKTAVKSPK
jgi:hypothetical protein